MLDIGQFAANKGIRSSSNESPQRPFLCANDSEQQQANTLRGRPDEIRIQRSLVDRNDRWDGTIVNCRGDAVAAHCAQPTRTQDTHNEHNRDQGSCIRKRWLAQTRLHKSHIRA
jgi:hypothetical protein